jgi:hypothetical protein
MPPSGFNHSAVRGALQFIQACYEDLLLEVRAGKHTSVETALAFEISQIEKALMTLHIDPRGNLVERKNSET